MANGEENGSNRRQPITVSQDFVQKEILQLKLDLLEALPSKDRVERLEKQVAELDVVVENIKLALLSPEKVSSMVATILEQAHSRTWGTRAKIIGAMAAFTTVMTFIMNFYVIVLRK